MASMFGLLPLVYGFEGHWPLWQTGFPACQVVTFCLHEEVLNLALHRTDGPDEHTKHSLGYDICNRVLDLLASGSNGASPYQA